MNSKNIKVLVALMVLVTMTAPSVLAEGEHSQPTVTSYAIGSATASGTNVDIHTFAKTTGDLAHKAAIVAAYSDGSASSGSMSGNVGTGYADLNMWSAADIGTVSPSHDVVIDAGVLTGVDGLLNTGIEVGGTTSHGTASAVVNADLTLAVTGHEEHQKSKFNSNSVGIATIGTDISSVSLELNVTAPRHN